MDWDFGNKYFFSEFGVRKKVNDPSECDDDQVYNPKTKFCIKKSGPVGKKIVNLLAEGFSYDDIKKILEGTPKEEIKKEESKKEAAQEDLSKEVIEKDLDQGEEEEPIVVSEELEEPDYQGEEEKVEEPMEEPKQRTRRKSKKRTPVQEKKVQRRKSKDKQEEAEFIIEEKDKSLPGREYLSQSSVGTIVNILLQKLPPNRVLKCILDDSRVKSKDFENTETFQRIKEIQQELEDDNLGKVEEVTPEDSDQEFSMSDDEQSAASEEDLLESMGIEDEDEDDSERGEDEPERGEEQEEFEFEEGEEEEEGPKKKPTRKKRRGFLPRRKSKDNTFGASSLQSLRSRSNEKNSSFNLLNLKKRKSNDYIENFFGSNLNKRFSKKTTIDGSNNSFLNKNTGYKKMKKRFNKGIRRRSFGSPYSNSIYGLQTNVPYTGLYPMSQKFIPQNYMGSPMNRSFSKPNLDNIQRSYVKPLEVNVQSFKYKNPN